MAVTGTFNGANIVQLPTSPGFAAVEFNMLDQVAVVSSPFTGQTQTQQWPGADMWGGTLTLPPLTQAQANIWTSFLAELRGMANCFQLGDPYYVAPALNSLAAPLTVDNTSGTNFSGSQTLTAAGWTYPNYIDVGTMFSVGNRLHKVLDLYVASAGVSGDVVLSVWPSLREVPTNGVALNFTNPTGLMRLANNKRTWNTGVSRTTRMSIPFIEFR